MDRTNQFQCGMLPERHRAILVLQKVTQSGAKQYILSFIILCIKNDNTYLTFVIDKLFR